MTATAPKRTRPGRRGGRKPVLHCSNCGTRGPDPCSEACQVDLDALTDDTTSDDLIYEG